MWTIDDIPDQTGRVHVVTGANSGLGKVSATALAGAGAHVVMAARNQRKAIAARDEILAAHPAASLELVELDLGSLDSVAAAAAAITGAHDRVDLLMNNAGLMAMPERRTADGFEMQWGVNVLGHWALTSHLLPRLVRTPGARVVSVTSTAQHIGALQGGIHDDPHLRGAYDPWKAYGQSKLGNRLLAVGLQRQFAMAGVEAGSYVAHPGLSNTDLQQRAHREGGSGGIGGFFARVTPNIGMDVTDGALSQLRAATEPGADPTRMYGPRWGNFGPPVSRPMVLHHDADIARLWGLARRDTGLDVDVTAALDAAA